MKETTNINRSLFMLGKVIAALETGARGALVPYRESKLTKLLMDCLDGSSLCLMIACCSPSSVHVEETLKTLSYAARVKNIRNLPNIRFDPRHASTLELQKEIKTLRAENVLLKQHIAQLYDHTNYDQGRNDLIASYRKNIDETNTHDQTKQVHMQQMDSLPLPAQSFLMPIPGIDLSNTDAYESFAKESANSRSDGVRSGVHHLEICTVNHPYGPLDTDMGTCHKETINNAEKFSSSSEASKASLYFSYDSQFHPILF